MDELTQCIITSSGHVTELEGKVTTDRVRELIKADYLDFVTLGYQRGKLWLMVVDDRGWESTVDETKHDGWTHVVARPTRPLKPVNQIATTLYRSVCKPGTTHQIVGDVVIMPDSE